MARLSLTDEHWSKLKTTMLENGIYDKPNLRMMMEGMLYRLRIGCPWRDLPDVFGLWTTIYKKFNRWSVMGKIHAIFSSLIHEPDLEWIFIDGTIVRAHQHGTGAARFVSQAIGRSCGGNSTKIHMAVDSYGLPIHFKLTAGNVHECSVAQEFIEELPRSQYVIADRGYDSESLRTLIASRKSQSVIPRKSNSKIGNKSVDWTLYGYRDLVENVFARLKHYRSIATRYDKLTATYSSMVALACSYLWLPM